jgi:outer membrane protein insertion porin family
MTKGGLCLLIGLFLSTFMVFAADRVLKVDVAGNDRIEKGFILNSVKTKEGDIYDPSKIREDIKSIFKTGYFSDVQVDVREEEGGKVVTYIVVERPLIAEVSVEGNKKVRTSDILEKIKVKAKTVLNVEKVKESVEEIRKLYLSKGYYATRVTYRIEYKDHEAKVRFVVEEAQKAYVRRISIVGARAIKEDAIKSVMKVREKGIFSWFTGSGILDEQELEEDRKRIQALYADRGYVRAMVEKPEISLSKDGRSISLTMKIDEGEPFKVGSVDLSGDAIPGVDPTSVVKTKKGKTFRSSLLSEDTFRLQDICQDEGYAFCEVTPLTEIDDEAREVHVTFDVSKGEEVYVRRINISGNLKTRDKVIRRELRLAEGDRFSLTALNKSRRNLRNTLYFKDVDLKTRRTDENGKVDIDVIVEERETGTLSFGAGYSSEERLLFTGSVSQENLFGTGRKVYLNAYLSSKTHEFDFSFIEPYLSDMDLSLGLSLFNYTRYFDTYDYRKNGGGLSLLRPLKEDMKGGMRYRFERIKVLHIAERASRYIKEQEGVRTTSSITLSFVNDTIDDKMNPSSGSYAQARLELAGGPFGGDNYFVKPILTYGRYFPLKFMGSSLFAKGEVGSVSPFGGKKVPIYERFFVGGMDTVRGFKYGMAGKKDEEGEAIGNEAELFFNFEWIFPIYKPQGLKGVVFYDTGCGFDSMKEFDLRHGAGLGIRWFSPIGPLRLELGFNLSPKRGEKRSVFDFTIGTKY